MINHTTVTIDELEIQTSKNEAKELESDREIIRIDNEHAWSTKSYPGQEYQGGT